MIISHHTLIVYSYHNVQSHFSEDIHYKSILILNVMPFGSAFGGGAAVRTE